SGSGMMPEVLKRATEPFFTTKPGRSGVGLTAAHGIWRRHRGAFSIESQPGAGTMIRLSVEAPPPSASHRVPKGESASSLRHPATASPEPGPTPSEATPGGSPRTIGLT
ncbi:MAG: ATP-binding protein, partial [Isosphaeraceae bacterium]